MVRYNLDDVNEDMVLGESLFHPSGELLLAAGYRIKDEYKKLLKKRGYASVLVDVEGTESVVPETVISEHLRQSMALSLSKMETVFLDAFSIDAEGSHAVEEFIKKNKHHLNKYLATLRIGPTIEKMIQEILNQPITIYNMSELLQAESGLFYHAVNVAVISLCLGKKFHFSLEEMRQLGIGAMNYDLGMVAVPRKILNKKDELTNTELMALRQHTVYGYLLLSQNPLIPATSAAVALQHHELQDGSGYPRCIKGANRPPTKDFSLKNTIHRFAEIVTVAETYENLIAGRHHDSRVMSAPEAIKNIIELGGTKLNSIIVKALVSIVPLYPTGARIRVINAPASHLIGYAGVIAKNDPAHFNLPLIMLYETKNHRRVKPILVETAKMPGFHFELVS
jgi:HD-GYP domain-containing protein (c-di-GMP phosphodiesterase class II)